jgi:tetratricopeptide (TPR) repeat protein
MHKNPGHLLDFVIALTTLLFSLPLFAYDSAVFKYHEHGVDYVLENKFSDAEKQFKEALKKNKGDRGSQEALQIIQDFNKGNISKEFLLLQFKGIKCMFNRDFSSALSKFKAALDIKPDSALANNNVGLAHLYLGSYKEATEYFQKALQHDKNYIDAYTNLAFSYNNYLIDPEKAKRYSLQALKVDPASSNAYAGLGHAYHLLGLPKKAVKHYRNALSLNQDDILTYQGLAQSLFVMGSREEAIKYYKKILALSPEFVDAYFGIADVYLSLSDTSNATVALQKAKELSLKMDDPGRLKLSEQSLEALQNSGN